MYVYRDGCSVAAELLIGWGDVLFSSGNGINAAEG